MADFQQSTRTSMSGLGQGDQEVADLGRQLCRAVGAGWKGCGFEGPVEQMHAVLGPAHGVFQSIAASK
jgi:hypothetical protein